MASPSEFPAARETLPRRRLGATWADRRATRADPKHGTTTSIAEPIPAPVVKQGWVNVIDSTSLRKGPLRDAWKLHYAVLSNCYLKFYRPSPTFQVRAFDVEARASSPHRPQSAPATTNLASCACSIRHTGLEEHPDLILSEAGAVRKGTVEALCHHLIFGDDGEYVRWAVRSVPMWARPEQVYAILTELLSIKDAPFRVADIVRYSIEDTPSMFLDLGCYNCLRVLIERGIAPTESQLASTCISRLEDCRLALVSALGVDWAMYDQHKGRSSVRPPASFTPDEFLSVNPEVLATQIHLFHLKYLYACGPAHDISSLLVSPHLSPFAHRNPLVFNAQCLHFLGEQVLAHVLPGDPSNTAARRATLLARWIEVAHILKVRGDMTGYLAIVMATLSPPLLRLRETWSLVPSRLVDDLRETGGNTMRTLDRRRLCVPRGVEPGRVFLPRGSWDGASSNMAVPYFGDLLPCMDSVHTTSSQEINFEEVVSIASSIINSLKDWSPEWPWTPSTDPKSHGQELPQIQQCLQDLYYNNTSRGTNYALYFERSLQHEPSFSGLYVLTHYHQHLPLRTGANTPLLFTQPLSNFCLFDPADIVMTMPVTTERKPSSDLALAVPEGANPQSNGSLDTFPLRDVQSASSTELHSQTRRSIQVTGVDELDMIIHERASLLRGGCDGMLCAIQDLAGVRQLLCFTEDGELVLKIVNESSDSHGSSAERIGHYLSPPLNPTNSDANRRSPSPIQHNSDPTSVSRERTSPLCALPRGGTLERLVDLLVLDVEHFSSHMRLNATLETLQAIPDMNIDTNLYRKTFLSTYRSFCSPAVLMDSLKKRLLGCKSASLVLHNEGDDAEFPNWIPLNHLQTSDINWQFVAMIHMGILECLYLWVSDFYEDFHNDQYLGDSFTLLMELLAKEIPDWDTLPLENAELKTYGEDIRRLWDATRRSFARQCYAPSILQSLARKERLSLCLPPSSNKEALGDFVTTLDLCIAGYYKDVQLVDWILGFELLETQSANTSGFFLPKSFLVNEELSASFQNIFILLENVRCQSTATTLLEAFPKSLRDLCTFHTRLSNWTISQLVDPKINVKHRSDRIMALLKILAICRKRMATMDFHGNQPGSRRRVPSFVSSVICNALLHPDVRLFNWAWRCAVKSLTGLKSHIATLDEVIPDFFDGTSPEPLRPCTGWVIERLLEVVCNVPNMLVENNRLINFDKRRYVYNFVSSLVASEVTTAELNRRPKMVFPDSSRNLPDTKVTREVSARENQFSRNGKVKLFSELLTQEQGKIKRDAKQRAHIEELEKSQQRAQTRKAASPAHHDGPERKGGKRLAVNSFIKAVRPLSMALNGQRPPSQGPGKIVSPAALGSVEVPNCDRRPSLSIDLRSLLSVSCPRGTRNRFLWKISSDNGTSYLLQATSGAELEAWLNAFALVRGMPINDSLQPKDDSSNWMRTWTSIPVFGVPLEDLCLRDNVSVPLVVEAFLSEIESRGISEVGIYRVPGSVASINALRQALDAGEPVRMDDDRWYDINAIAGAFKLFLRDLPGDLIEPQLLEELKAITEDIADESVRISAYRVVMQKTRPYNYQFLRRMYTHFAKVSRNAAINKMPAINLAIVFGMGLSPTPAAGIGISPDLGIYQTMVKSWINSADQVFPDGLEEPCITNDPNGSCLGK